MKLTWSIPLVLLSIGISSQGTAQKELEKLSGTWTLISAAGQQLPSGTHAGLIIKGDKYQGITNGKPDEGGTIKLDAATTPVSLDMLISEGKYAGQTQLGLVLEATADTLTLALAEPGATVRPTATADKLVLTRVKPLAKDLQGSWEGAIDAGGQTLRLVVKLSNGTDGLATGTLVSVDQGNKEAPIAAVIQTGSKVRLVVPSVRGTYDGELKGGQLIGTWSQPKGSLPLTLKRGA